MATNIFTEVNGGEATAVNYRLVLDSIRQQA